MGIVLVVTALFALVGVLLNKGAERNEGANGRS